MNAGSLANGCGVWVGLLLDVTVKATLMLVLAGAASAALCRASAAWRHMVWTLALASLLALPVLALVVPVLQVPIMPRMPAVTSSPPDGAAPVLGTAVHVSDAAFGQTQTSRFNGSEVASPLTLGPEPPDDAAVLEPASAQASATPTLVRSQPAYVQPVNWPVLAFVVWIVGVLVVLASLGIGTGRVLWILARATPPADSSWTVLLESLRSEFGLKRRVVLRQSHLVGVPMTWGLWRPVILLPSVADDWSDQRRRVVLLHELAHIQRWDYLTQLLARFACAAYWFHPLVWFAARRLRVEREWSCDDEVLQAGTKASDYAEHLLEVAHSLRAARVAMLVSVSMACRSQLERRLLSILDSARSRRRISRASAVLAVAVACLVVLPLAAVSLRAASGEPAADPASAAGVSATAERPGHAGGNAEAPGAVDSGSVFNTESAQASGGGSSPLDKLDRTQIPPYELKVAGGGDPEKAPAGLVAILGNSRLKHWGFVGPIAYRPDGKELASCGDDGTIRFWDVTTGDERLRIEAHAYPGGGNQGVNS
ncbi:MAG: hypothetical protein HY000_26075, partial [Planctomycetes bacterium]|nr:hypothetical protein [Planctomycetota bacterium]